MPEMFAAYTHGSNTILNISYGVRMRGSTAVLHYVGSEFVYN